MSRIVVSAAAQAVLTIGITLFCTAPVMAQDQHKASQLEIAGTANKQNASILGNKIACQGGTAGAYPCQRTDLMAFVAVSDLDGGFSPAATSTNDIWGWTDPITSVEYALVGLNSGTSFVDISDPENPVVVGFLPTHTNTSDWRDIKVHDDHAFIVSEASGHGMQVFDLTQLRSAGPGPVMFEETSHYDAFNDAHNIVINEDTGFAYVVGANGGGTTCGGALHMVDISTPTAPAFAGCYADTQTGRSLTGYTHDAQCVVYHGPDTAHQGKEICIGSNENAISIADVTDKAQPTFISRGSYPTASYVHQGWLSEDHRYFFQDDELDELGGKTGFTRTIVWDLLDLDDPVVLDEHLATTPNIDHNMYVKGSLIFQSNYTGGLRILDSSDPANLVEVAYFDTYPGSNAISFSGTWSNYPYFESGIIVVTGIDEGLFLLKSDVVGTSVRERPELPAHLTLAVPYPNPFDDETTLTLTLDASQRVKVEAYDLLGRQVALLFDDVVVAQAPQLIAFRAENLPDGKYIIRATGRDYTVSRVVTLIR